MIKTTFFLLLLMPLFTFGQVDTLKIETIKRGDSFLSNVRVDTNLNIGVFEIHFSKGRLSNSYYYVIDFNEKKVLSSFNTKNWSYLYNSWIDGDSILHLAKGRIFTRRVLFDLNSGSKVDDKTTQSEKEQAKESSNDGYIDSQDLYCTSSIVYYGGYRVFYDDKLKCFIMDKE